MVNKEPVQKILIIDDDPLDIDIFRSILENKYQLNVAINGKMGLRRARITPHPDLILLDVMMPEMDGFEVCRLLKADPKLKEIPVIFVTARDSVIDETSGFSVGAVDYIIKPFSTDVVLARVRTHLALRAATTRVEQQNRLLLYEREVVETVLSRMRQSTQFDSACVRFLFSPLEKTSGDIVLAAFRPDGGQHVLLGDFTGHGLPAAIGGPIVAEIFYSRTLAGDTMDRILEKINQVLCEKLPVDMFMAGGVLELTPARDQALIWNCSIPNILLFQQGQTTQRIPSDHRPLGILLKPYQTGTILAPLHTTDRITLYSDGLVECLNPSLEAYGTQRAETMLAELISSGAELEAVHEYLQLFLAGNKQRDDITVAEITV